MNAGTAYAVESTAMAHREVPVKVTAWIDEGVAALVAALNSSDRLVTVSSCEGEGEAPAYVFFRYVGSAKQAAEFYSHFGRQLADQTRFAFTMELTWRPGYDEPMAKIEVPRADVGASARWVKGSLAATV